MLSNPQPTRSVLLSPFYKWEDWGSESSLTFTWAHLGLGPRFLCFQSSLAVTTLYRGGQRWWQKHRNPQRRQVQVPPANPWNAPEPVSRTRGWALCLSPDTKHPAASQGTCQDHGLWCWLLTIAPLGGSRELPAIVQTPCKIGSCSQPHGRFGFLLLLLFFLSLSLLLHPRFSGYCS